MRSRVSVRAKQDEQHAARNYQPNNRANGNQYELVGQVVLVRDKVCFVYVAEVLDEVFDGTAGCIRPHLERFARHFERRFALIGKPVDFDMHAPPAVAHGAGDDRVLGVNRLYLTHGSKRPHDAVTHLLRVGVGLNGGRWLHGVCYAAIVPVIAG